MTVARRWPARLAGAAAAAALVLAGTAAQAYARHYDHGDHPAVFWVSSAATVSGRGTSCAAPAYNTIQAAVSAAPAGATVRVCSGTYTEQLQITHAVNITGVGGVTLRLPSTPVNSTTACDTAPGTGSFQPDQDGVVICGHGTVQLKGLTVDAAWPAATCDDSLYGILVAGGATLRFVDSAVTAAGAQPINGCQGGIGIQAGMAWTTPVEKGHLFMSDSLVSGYQKNGITVDGAGSTATIRHSTFTGAGPTTQIAQNGIQIGNGASGTITGSVISGNECNNALCGPDSQTQTQSTGVLLFGAAAGAAVTDSAITDNDIGVYYAASQSEPAPAKPQALITGDKLLRNRYEAVGLDQGRATVSYCTMRGSNVGIQILQYTGQSFGSQSVATRDVIRDMSVATVQVSSDQAAHGDLPGRFVISRSDINSAPVLDNSSNLPVIRHHDY